MLTNQHKGSGLIQSLVANLAGVTLRIAGPTVRIGGVDHLLCPDREGAEAVTIDVRDGQIVGCSDERCTQMLNAGAAEVRAGQLIESSHDETVQSIVDAYTLDHARKHKQDQIALYSKALQDSFVALYSKGEMSAWSIKTAEARAFGVSGDVGDAPVLAHEAAKRYPAADLTEALVALCAKVNGNAWAFALLQAEISGVEGFHRDSIKDLDSYGDVDGYDFFGGWPAI